jgi:hypothetical protein
MTSLETGMAFMLGLTVLAGLSAFFVKGDPMRMTRVLLAIGSALVFQLHVLIEGPRPAHWPLYAAGFVVLVAVAGQWWFSQRTGGAEPPEPPAR